jgi:multidrug efflux pump subunit AcrA (membrane-fusion protein)
LLPKGAASQKDLDTAIADRGEARAGIQSARAAVDRAALDLEFTKVTAPISGRIGRYLITEGNLVTLDSTLLTTIVSIDPMYAYFDADEGSVLYVRQLIREQGATPVPARRCRSLGLANETGFPPRDRQFRGQSSQSANRQWCAGSSQRARSPLTWIFRPRPAAHRSNSCPVGHRRAIDTDQTQKIVCRQRQE